MVKFIAIFLLTLSVLCSFFILLARIRIVLNRIYIDRFMCECASMIAPAIEAINQYNTILSTDDQEEEWLNTSELKMIYSAMEYYIGHVTTTMIKKIDDKSSLFYTPSIQHLIEKESRLSPSAVAAFGLARVKILLDLYKNGKLNTENESVQIIFNISSTME